MIPVEDLRTWVGLEADDDSADALLTQLEAAAVAEVELTTGQYLGPVEEFVDRVIGDGTYRLRLPKGPVTAVESITEAWPTHPDDEPVAVTDFVLRSPHVIATNAYFWVRGAEYEVTYTAGYAEEDIPPLYRQAVIDLVRATYPAAAASQSSGVDAGEFKAESLGEYSYTLADGATSSTDSDGARASVSDILARLPRRIRV